MANKNYEEATILADQMCDLLPIDDLKEIAREAYANDIVATKPLIKALFKKTKNRYFKTVWLLWEYKIFVPNGIIILGRIDGYCTANKNGYYIDMCIYKDIFGAIRTSNSSFFKSRNSSTR